MKTLREKIEFYNAAYRKGEPLISDAEYDALVEELKQTDPNNSWFNAPEPAPVTSSRKVSLPIPMKSLNKVKNLSELKNWCLSLGLTNRTTLICMPKFDGVSLLHDERTGMTYSRGGIENEGQNCTAHYNAANIPSPSTDLHFTFGEFVFSRQNWRQFKTDTAMNTEENFKSPRNTAAGLLNRDNPCDYLKYVSFFRYGTDEKSMEDYATFERLIDDICTQYQQPKLFKSVLVEDLSDEFLIGLFKEWSMEYPIDGIVIYVNDLNIWATIGRNQTTGNPLYAIAYKHPDFTDSFETTVKGISWKVSKAGALKPVVNIETVDTGDCNMENPTGYNAKWIYDHQIAKGARILVTRSGGVIPKILETLQPPTKEEDDKLWEEMCVCPHCGAPTKWNESQVELCCTNTNCPGIQLAKIVFFYTTLGAENMGEETLAKIFDAGFKTIRAILNISFQDLMNIEGFAEATSNIVLQNNRKIMGGVDLPTLMQASDCFKGIGTIKARKLLEDMSETERQAFCSGDFIYKEPDRNSEKFKELSVTTQNLLWGYLPFMRFLHDTQIPIIMPTQQKVMDGKCNGLSVCISGFRDSNFENAIINAGGNMVSGVSKKTTHLVVKDKSAISSKISKAQSLDIPILDIEEFNNLFLS